MIPETFNGFNALIFILIGMMIGGTIAFIIATAIAELKTRRIEREAWILMKRNADSKKGGAS